MVNVTTRYIQPADQQADLLTKKKEHALSNAIYSLYLCMNKVMLNKTKRQQSIYFPK